MAWHQTQSRRRGSQTLLVVGREGRAVGGSAAVEALGHLLHALRYAEIADAELAERAIHVRAVEVENPLADDLAGLALPLQPVEQNDCMQHDHLEAAIDGVGHSKLRVEHRIARLRHDRAVKGRCNGSGFSVTAEQAGEHDPAPCSGGGRTLQAGLAHARGKAKAANDKRQNRREGWDADGKFAAIA